MDVGTIYYVTDEDVIERSNGSSWDDMSAMKGGGSSGNKKITRFSGTSGATVQDSAVELADDGSFGFPDGVTQVFNPDGTNAGLNVGAEAGDPSVLVDGDIWYNSTANELRARIDGVTVTLSSRYTVGITVDGGGSAISTGLKGFRSIARTGVIVKARLLADQSGSVVFDIWLDAYANYPPTVADTITASAKPTISAGVKDEDTTLTGWTTAVTAGDILGFNVDSAATIERVTLELEIAVPT